MAFLYIYCLILLLLARIITGLVHGTYQKSAPGDVLTILPNNVQKSAPEDVLTVLPNNVLNNIMDRLPIQDAVRTSILSTNWRYKWTVISQVVFGKEFFEEYLFRTKRKRNCFGARDISRVLRHLDGVVTKFVLYIPHHLKLGDVEDIHHCAKLLSEKKVEDLTLINMHETPIEFPTPLFSCVELKRLKLRNCCFPRKSSFHGFPNLLIMDFTEVILEGREYAEFIASCPLLVALCKLNDTTPNPTGKVKPAEIAKLNLKDLCLSLCELYDAAITSFDFFQFTASFPKLEFLALDLQNCKFKAVDEVSARSRFSSALHSLKVLELLNIDLENRGMVFFFFHLIRNSPNLEVLRITPTDVDRVSPSPCTNDEIDNAITGNLQQLRLVILDGIQASDIELCLISSLLGHCSLLEQMFITTSSKTNRYLELTTNLLVIPRASPKAKVYFNQSYLLAEI